MKIHEYQAKQILKDHGLPVPNGKATFSAADATSIAESLKTKVWVVKAQIHAGGRGKGGGVKVAKTIDEVRTYVERLRTRADDYRKFEFKTTRRRR